MLRIPTLSFMPEIRDASVADRPALVECMRRASLVWDDTRDDLLAHPEVFDVPETALAGTRVAEDRGAVIGFATLIGAELDGLFVAPEAMGRGVGRALIDDVARRAGADGVDALDVVANSNAQGFYEAVGFVVTGTVQTRFAPALRMRRRLRG
jgi:ribosomal protein S18 acetylase RimI-like enzyme